MSKQPAPFNASNYPIDRSYFVFYVLYYNGIYVTKYEVEHLCVWHGLKNWNADPVIGIDGNKAT